MRWNFLWQIQLMKYYMACDIMSSLSTVPWFSRIKNYTILVLRFTITNSINPKIVIRHDHIHSSLNLIWHRVAICTLNKLSCVLNQSFIIPITIEVSPVYHSITWQQNLFPHTYKKFVGLPKPEHNRKELIDLIQKNDR